MALSHNRQLTTASIATARMWADACRAIPEPRSARLLAEALQHQEGLAYILDFVDSVIRPEDPGVAAAALKRLSKHPPSFLPAPLLVAMRKGTAAAPRPLLPLVRRVFADLVGDLVVDVGGSIRRTLRRLQRDGACLNVNLLGEAVLGDDHALARTDQTLRLLELPEVDYVSIKVSAVLGPHATWGHEPAVAEATRRLSPLFERAAASGKFINLDMEEYRDLHLTLEVFERLLSSPALASLSAGIAVQTYLRESDLVLQQLDDFARRRVAAGGSPIKVRLVKGANLAMERVAGQLHGWRDPVFATKAETDASFLHALDRCLRPEAAARLRVGVASHNVFSLAAAWELAKDRGVTGAVDFEMLSGMGMPLQHVILTQVRSLRRYVPVVPRSEYESAISYLVRRLEENAAPENFMAGAIGLGSDPSFLDLEEERFREACAHPAPLSSSWATQQRLQPEAGFANTSDTDPALISNQRWAESIRARLPSPELGSVAVAAANVTDQTRLHALLETAQEAGRRWAATDGSTRARLLHAVGLALEGARADLITVAADETDKLLDQGDVEVSEACDFANYYAQEATALYHRARQIPPTVTLVAPPWNFPIAIPLGGVAAALAVGSAVILKPAPPARRVAAVLVETLWAAGVPKDLVQLAVVDDGPLGELLIKDTRVDQVILTGAAETAELFRSWRPGLPLLAETSGKNAIVVTPSADLDLAAADLAASAFGHSGQKCSAASLGILVGSVASSRRFLGQLLDAVSSLQVGWPAAPDSRMGPLTQAPSDKLMRALTALESGQRWLLSPRRLSDRLWRPGIRLGVAPGSEFHQVEYFGPVLGLMAAPDLDTAIAWQNGTSFGLTAGLHSLDAAEVQHWLDAVEAGNLYVNRTITGAIVRRQPFGGWKRSVVGNGAKAGGPNYLAGLGNWESTLETGDEAWLGAAAESDSAALAQHFRNQDPTALPAEINVLRYRPAPITVRVEDASQRDVLREHAAATASGASVTFSFREEPSAEVRIALAGLHVVVADDAQFDREAIGRVRHLGTRDLLSAAAGRIDLTVFSGPCVPEGRVALLPYLQEQSVTITNHRFGHPSGLTGYLRL